MHTIQDSPVGPNGQIVFSRPLFGISAAREGDAYVIRIEGELDLSECPRLERALQEGAVSLATRILIDLDKLTFIDAAGLNVVVAAWRRSVADGRRLQVTRGRGSVARMLHLTDLDTVLSFVPSDPKIGTGRRALNASLQASDPEGFRPPFTDQRPQ
jgi:anti-sigma B factor antagonist